MLELTDDVVSKLLIKIPCHSLILILHKCAKGCLYVTNVQAIYYNWIVIKQGGKR